MATQKRLTTGKNVAQTSSPGKSLYLVQDVPKSSIKTNFSVDDNAYDDDDNDDNAADDDDDANDGDDDDDDDIFGPRCSHVIHPDGAPPSESHLIFTNAALEHSF